MKIKMNKTLKNVLIMAFIFFTILYIYIFLNMYFPNNKAFAKETNAEAKEKIKISNKNEINIDQIIDNNTNNGQTEQIEQHEEILEYLTEYRINNNIPKGTSYVIQEGREGKQNIVVQKTYKDGELIAEEQIGAEITKASCKKIVEIGGAKSSSSYNAKKGDIIYITSDELYVMSEPSEEGRKITTLRKNNELKILEISKNWYKIKYENIEGWVKSECTTYTNLDNEEKQETSKNKQELISKLDININLNKPSGLSLEQFKKILSDPKDTNKIFSNNAEYFYYIEKQYNINGVFVASVGIHESAWGTSKIALQKNNLFGYGAYDSNPYNGAYEFENYSESIDLVSRVFVKYYLNPKGIAIYGGETAIGTYYNGATLYGVNNKYASDKNWSNAVYTNMKYLYNKL